MYLATSEGTHLPIPALIAIQDWKRRQHALIHLSVAGHNLSGDEDLPNLRTTSRIPKIGAATRILLAHNPTLIDFGFWVSVYPLMVGSTEILAINLLQLEHDCMHLAHARPSKWRHDHEHALVELLSERFDLVTVLFGYRHWPLSIREQFIGWHINPVLASRN